MGGGNWDSVRWHLRPKTGNYLFAICAKAERRNSNICPLSGESKLETVDRVAAFAPTEERERERDTIALGLGPGALEGKEEEKMLFSGRKRGNLSPDAVIY